MISLALILFGASAGLFLLVVVFDTKSAKHAKPCEVVQFRPKRKRVDLRV